MPMPVPYVYLYLAFPSSCCLEPVGPKDLLKPLRAVGKEPFTLDASSGTARTASAMAALLRAPERGQEAAHLVLRVNE